MKDLAHSALLGFRVKNSEVEIYKWPPCGVHGTIMSDSVPHSVRSLIVLYLSRLLVHPVVGT